MMIFHIYTSLTLSFITRRRPGVRDLTPARFVFIFIFTRAARVITQQGNDARSNDIRNQLGWDTLDQRRHKHRCRLGQSFYNC